MKVGEAIAATLVAEGVDTVFSLLGDANMEVLVALGGHGVRIVECRHEAAAMAMADGYARASGRLGLCAVTAGPALAHTFTPLTSAVRIGSPVVVLTGPRARDDPAERQNLDHQGLARLTGAGYLAISNPDTVVERVRGVVDQALATRTPVVLDVPIDLQKQEHPWPVEPREAAAWQRPQRIAPDPAVVAEAARILAGAERPVLIAGEGAVRSGARAELLELGERTGALLATALNARGWFDGEEFDAGVAGLYSRPEVVELFTQSDCVVSFGASMNRYTTMEGYLFPEATFVQVDIKPPAPMPSGDVAACYVQADALRAAQALLGALGGVRNEGYRTDDVAKRLQVEPDTKAFDDRRGRAGPARAVRAARPAPARGRRLGQRQLGPLLGLPDPAHAQPARADALRHVLRRDRLRDPGRGRRGDRQRAAGGGVRGRRQPAHAPRGAGDHGPRARARARRGDERPRARRGAAQDDRARPRPRDVAHTRGRRGRGVARGSAARR